MKKNNNKKNFKMLSSISIFILITTIAVLFFLLNKKNNQIVNIQTEITPTISFDRNKTYTPTEIINSLKSTLNTSCTLEETESNGNSYWLNKKNNYSTAVVLTGKKIDLTSKTIDKHSCNYGNYQDLTSVTIDSLKPVRLILDNFFQSNGFIKDENNNIEYYSDDFNDIDTLVIGYSQINTKCIVTMYYHSNPFTTIFCGLIDQEKTNWYQELYPFVNSRNDPENRINITKIIDKYATGGANPPIGGGGVIWFAVKINNQWKVVWESQDNIPCQIIEKYNIPKEIYEGNCYSPDSTNEY